MPTTQHWNKHKHKNSSRLTYLTLSSESCCLSFNVSVMSLRRSGWFSKKCIEYWTHFVRILMLMSLNLKHEKCLEHSWMLQINLSTHIHKHIFCLLWSKFLSFCLSLRNIHGTSTDTFKWKLDSWLTTVPNEHRIDNYAMGVVAEKTVLSTKQDMQWAPCASPAYRQNPVISTHR